MRSTRAAALAALCALAPAAGLAQQRSGGGQAACGVEGKPPCDPRATNETALNEVLPTTADLINELRRRYGEARRAAAGVDVPSTYVAPLSQRINMGFGAGGAIPIIATEANYPTTLSFFDNTGKEWPVAYVGASNADEPANQLGGFQARVVQEGSNAIHVSTRTPCARGGLTVQLLRAPRPLSFVLRGCTGQYVADGIVQVVGRGPNAALGVAVRADSVEAGGSHLADMLDGITPAGAVELGVTGGSADNFRAYAMNGKVYLVARRASLISPPWDASSNGPDETTVYAVPEQPSGRTPMIVSDGLRNFTIFANRRGANAAAATGPGR